MGQTSENKSEFEYTWTNFFLSVHSDSKVSFIREHIKKGIETVFIHGENELMNTLIVAIGKFTAYATETQQNSSSPVSSLSKKTYSVK